MVYAAHDSVDIGNLYTDWDFSVALYNAGNGDYVLTQLRDGQYKMRAHAATTPGSGGPAAPPGIRPASSRSRTPADLTGIDWRLPY